MSCNKVISVYVLGILVCSSIACLFFTMDCSAAGTTIYVDDSNVAGPWNGTQEHPYKNIQDGVNAAVEGDIVSVSSGTYYENVYIDKSLNLIGSSNPVINGQNLHNSTIEIMSDNVTISGFEIRNHIGLSSYYSGIAVGKQEMFRYVVINDCSLTDAYYGIIIKGDHLSISNCVIMNIQAYGIMVVSGVYNTISYNLIDANLQGINLQWANNIEIYNNTISNNHEIGLKILSSSSHNYIYHNHFVDNNQNAYDANQTNVWDNGYPSGGNNWSDYNGIDNNNGPNQNLLGPDGIGDTPYNIVGGSNQDRYPLGIFFKPPTGKENQLPTAYITYVTPNPATQGQTISFSGSGSDIDGYIVSYNWRSNVTGQLSTQPSFTNSNLPVGAHTISFKVQDNAGAWSSEQSASVTINAKVGNPPTASIDEITPNPAKLGQAVLFHGHGSSANGTISVYQWSSDKDGVFCSTASCIVTNLTSGTHLIYFKVKDDMNQWSLPVTMTLVIGQNASMNPSNQAPVANIGGPYHGRTNESIIFNASQSHDSDGTIHLYAWSFGDNTSGTGASPTHSYANPGSYQVIVLITDDDGASSQASTKVDITQSSSQSDTPSGNNYFALTIPFPVVVVAIIISMVIIFGMFIHWMKKR